MKLNLMKAAVAAGLTAGLVFPGVANAAGGDGQQFFYVPGVAGPADGATLMHPMVHDLFGIHHVPWNADIFPINGFSTLDASVAVGVANLIASIKENGSVVNDEDGDYTQIMCYGTGCIVAQKVKPAFGEGGELSQYKLFEVTGYRDPSNADGGLLTKMPSWIPGYTPVNQDDYGDTDFEASIAREYDLLADAQDKPGVVAFLNSVVAALYYGKEDYGFDDLSQAMWDGQVVVTITNNPDGTQRSHYLITHPYLPLTRPLRELVLAITPTHMHDNVNAGFDRVDTWLKDNFIDNRYDQGSNPEVNQREESTVDGSPFTPGPIEGTEDGTPNVGPDSSNANARYSASTATDESGAEGDGQTQEESNPPVGSGESSKGAGEGDGVGSDGSGDAASAPVGGEAPPAQTSEKKTWKERMAEKRAERKAEREARKAEREAKREERQQAETTNDTNTNDTDTSDTNASNGEGDGSNGDAGGAGGGEGSGES